MRRRRKWGIIELYENKKKGRARNGGFCVLAEEVFIVEAMSGKFRVDAEVERCLAGVDGLHNLHKWFC